MSTDPRTCEHMMTYGPNEGSPCGRRVVAYIDGVAFCRAHTPWRVAKTIRIRPGEEDLNYFNLWGYEEDEAYDLWDPRTPPPDDKC